MKTSVDDGLPDDRIRASLRDDLTRIGLRAGDPVMVHAAMSKVGPLLNGSDALSNALLDVVGPEGTMLVYTSLDSVHDDRTPGADRFCAIPAGRCSPDTCVRNRPA